MFSLSKKPSVTDFPALTGSHDEAGTSGDASPKKAVAQPDPHKQWRAAQAEHGFEYPELQNTHIVPRHLEGLWEAIDRNDDVKLNKALVAPGAVERSELVATPRTQRWSETTAMEMTPLMAVVAIGSAQLTQTMLRNGGPAVRTALAAKAGAAYTHDAMSVAAKYGHNDIMDLLVDNRFGNATALKVVENESPQPATVRWLRSQGITSEQFGAAFENAFDRGDLAGLEVLVKAGGVELQERRHFVAKAIGQGRLDLAQKLIELGSPINGTTPVKVIDSGDYSDTAPLTMAIAQPRLVNANATLGCAIGKDPQPQTEQQVNARRALIAFLVNNGARVNDQMLASLVRFGDFDIYADINKTENYWPTSPATIKTFENLVDRTKHPMVGMMLEYQRFVVEDDAKLGKLSKKASTSEVDKLQDNRDTNMKNFVEACEIVMDGTSSISLAGNTKLALQNDAHVAPEVRQGGMGALAKQAKSRLGLSDKPAEEQGRALVIVDKKAAKKKDSGFSLFKRNK